LTKRRVVLDTDVGIDDALMIMQLTAEPAAEIVAIGSSHGNCSAAQAAVNAIRVLDALGVTDIPVAQGAESPDPDAGHAPHVHGKDGLADADIPGPSRPVSGEHAVDQLIRLGAEFPGELDLIAVGTMTNLALALARDPGSLNRFRSVNLLGGYARRPRPGDPPTEDANIFNSPDAAEQLMASRTKLTVIPIDTTAHVVFTDAQIERIKTGETPQARLAWKLLPFYFDFYQRRLNHWTSRVHDPAVAAVVLDPSLIATSVERQMIVEPYNGRFRAVGLESGDPSMARAGNRAAATIVTELDRDRFLDRLVDGIVNPLGALPEAV
jgi:purine nucleosidase